MRGPRATVRMSEQVRVFRSLVNAAPGLVNQGGVGEIRVQWPVVGAKRPGSAYSCKCKDVIVMGFACAAGLEGYLSFPNCFPSEEERSPSPMQSQQHPRCEAGIAEFLSQPPSIHEGPRRGT